MSMIDGGENFDAAARVVAAATVLVEDILAKRNCLHPPRQND